MEEKLTEQIRDLQQQINDLARQTDENLRTHSHGLNGVYSIHIDDIVGLFQTITATPTDNPTDMWSQIRVAKISSTWYLYVYDGTNNVWKSVVLS